MTMAVQRRACLRFFVIVALFASLYYIFFFTINDGNEILRAPPPIRAQGELKLVVAKGTGTETPNSDSSSDDRPTYVLHIG
jgi:hypothetical protein